MGLALEAFGLPGLARFGQFGFVGFHGLASAAHGFGRAGVHSEPDTMAEVPRGLEAATEHALKLAGADAFLGRAEQVDRLKPQIEREMAVLKDRSDPHGELFAAAVALPKADLGHAFWVLLAGLGADAFQTAKALGLTAMRTDRAVRPKLLFHV